MKSRLKSNNFIALLIALILIAIGFALGFLHRQSESNEKSMKKPVTEIINAASETDTFSV